MKRASNQNKITKFKKLFISLLCLIVFAGIFSGCKEDEPIDLNTIAQWKQNNDSYLINMKDSIGFVKDSVPTNIGSLYYYHKITKAGSLTAGSPIATSSVKVFYKGSFITGEVFDQNNSTKPSEFVANKVISGWTLNLIQMKVGEIRTIILPYQLAYGASGYMSIFPYSTLRFEIQLVSFE